MAESEPAEQAFPEISEAVLAARHGSVLSDQDIKIEINIRGLVFEHGEGGRVENGGVKADCYDLRIGHVVGKRIGVKSWVETKAIVLRPGELVTLLSKEWLDLPDNIAGLLIPRNRPAQKGILILNAGHVDPLYKGPVMAQVVNLSDQDRSIRLDTFDGGVFSVVFSYISHSTTKRSKRYETIDEKIGEIQAAVGEQAEILILAESVMREKFVTHDRFTGLLAVNALGLVILVGVATSIFSIIFELRDLKEIGLDRRSLWEFGLLAVTVFVGVASAQTAVVLIPRAFRAWRRSKAH